MDAQRHPDHLGRAVACRAPPARAEEDASLDLEVIAPSASVPLSNLIVVRAPGKLSRAEKVTSFDLGYRQQLTSTLSLDAAAFAARYTDLRSGDLPEVGMEFVMTPMGAIPYLRTATATAMGLEARTHGAELAVDWHRFNPGGCRRLTYFRDRMSDPLGAMREDGYRGKAPRHTASLRSSYNLGRDWQLDGWLRHRSALPSLRFRLYRTRSAPGLARYA
ncbi:MAG: TonB-dependent receptor [Sterolibacteriaceae bacterium]|nr:TonB-dependent receptor [Sterolibacteriaceae bacterium]